MAIEKMREFLLPDLYDKPPCKSRPWWEGAIITFTPNGKEVVAKVRGKTLDEVRERKYRLLGWLNKENEGKNCDGN